MHVLWLHMTLADFHPSLVWTVKISFDRQRQMISNHAFDDSKARKINDSLENDVRCLRLALCERQSHIIEELVWRWFSVVNAFTHSRSFLFFFFALNLVNVSSHNEFERMLPFDWLRGKPVYDRKRFKAKRKLLKTINIFFLCVDIFFYSFPSYQ